MSPRERARGLRGRNDGLCSSGWVCLCGVKESEYEEKKEA